MRERPDATNEEFARHCSQREDCSIGHATVNRVLHRMGLARKKSLRAVEGDSAAIEALRWKYELAMRQVAADAHVVVDETGCRTDMTRTHGRAPRGKRLTG
ncbi:hypothetical protein [Corallococcus exiguus]|uniref:hypothetical protein n=1 Tax=Corallococcus exiguus TaxID=83462 RepID=UPI003DA49FFF